MILYIFAVNRVVAIQVARDLGIPDRHYRTVGGWHTISGVERGQTEMIVHHSALEREDYGAVMHFAQTREIVVLHLGKEHDRPTPKYDPGVEAMVRFEAALAKMPELPAHRPDEYRINLSYPKWPAFSVDNDTPPTV